MRILASLANAVMYGTDVFGAIVLRPAIAAVDDRTLTQLLGHIQEGTHEQRGSSNHVAPGS